MRLEECEQSFFDDSNYTWYVLSDRTILRIYNYKTNKVLNTK